MKSPAPRPKAYLLTIGDELLKGSVLNTNARFLGGQLTALGFEVAAQASCPDSIPAIKQKISRALDCELVILTGGLGPTPDDVTRDAIADFFHTRLVLSNKQYAFIRNHYRKRGKTVPEIVKKEAMFPESAVPLFNRYGIALGFYLEVGRSLMIVLPGVPSELERMFQNLVVPLLKRRFDDLPPRHALIVRMAGLSEPDVMRRLGTDFFRDPFDFGIYPGTGEVALRLYSGSLPVLRRLESLIRKRLGRHVYAYREESLGSALGKLLARGKKTVAVAESCTGGLIAAEIAKTAGASRYFKGAVTAYSNEIKSRILGLPPELFDRKGPGAVSRQTTVAMARSVREKFRTDYGLSVTGVAGPGGGTPAKPVGTVYIGFASATKTRFWHERFLGDREQVQHKAVKKALEHLWGELK